jgi:hypothetical protein
MLATARSGLPLKFVAQAGGIAYDGFLDWRNRDSEFDQALEQARLASVQERWEQIMKLGKGTEEKPGDWKALAWSLERTEASSFARPEVQLNLIQQNNLTENHLSITITPEEIREIEAQAAPSRAAVRKMFEEYQLRRSGNGNGEKQRTIDVQAEPVKADKPAETRSAEDTSVRESVRKKFAEYRPQPAVQPPIVRKEGEENSAVFWNQFASGDGQRQVDKATAFFSVKTIVSEVGARFGNQQIVFGSGPISVSDVISVIERLGWLAINSAQAGLLNRANIARLLSFLLLQTSFPKRTLLI